MNTAAVVVRSIHILAGVFWAGAVFFAFAFLVPAARSVEGGRFMERLAARFGPALGVAAGLTVLSGLLMYWGDSQGFRAAWILGPTGLTFTVGALCAMAAAAVGGTLMRRTGLEMQRLGTAAAGVPTVEQAARMRALQRRQAGALQAATALLAVSVVAMAAARYV